MEAMLDTIAPGIIGERATFKVLTYQGKAKLLRELPKRLRGYAKRVENENLRVVVLVDRDAEDCRELKTQLESFAQQADLSTKTNPRPDGGFFLVNRIVIEELESWFFGDTNAICSAFPGVPDSLGEKPRFRDPDAIKGGTWEALHKVLREAGYYPTGLPKTEVARKIAEKLIPEENRSRSFQVFRDGLESLF